MGSNEPQPIGFPSDWAHDLVQGPEWDAAIAYGIDVSLILENLRRTPTERLARLQQINDFHDALRNARPAR